MKEICIPIPSDNENQTVDVEVKIDDRSQRLLYRLESFCWDIKEDYNFRTDDEISERLMKIYQLKKSIETYDSDWELLQIFTPAEKSKFIQVLFRKK